MITVYHFCDRCNNVLVLKYRYLIAFSLIFVMSLLFVWYCFFLFRPIFTTRLSYGACGEGCYRVDGTRFSAFSIWNSSYSTILSLLVGRSICYYSRTHLLYYTYKYVLITFIIFSANLSDSYFTNRQDRYMVIENVPSLTDFYSSVVSAVASCSFTLLDDGPLQLDPRCDIHPYLGNGFSIPRGAFFAIMSSIY